jgi:OFA family oxalate/formate antiporter-like MFS transporter
MIYGVAFLILVLAGSFVMKNPPAGWKPAGWTPPQAQPGKKLGSCQKPKEMLKSKSFYLLWIMFLIGALAGLMVIGNVQNFAKSPTDGFTINGFSPQEAIDFAVIGAAVCLPIFNGAGRIIWGQISDRIGRSKALISMFVFQAAMMTFFFYTTSNPYLFYVIAALIGFNFGGNFALFPLLAGYVQDAGLSFLYAFIPAAIMCVIAAVLGLVYHRICQKKSI